MYEQPYKKNSVPVIQMDPRTFDLEPFNFKYM